MKFKAISTLVAVIIGIFIIFLLLEDLAAKKNLILDNSQPAAEVSSNRNQLQTLSISAPNGVINAEVADSPDKQQQGLSGRTELAPNDGMLFAFAMPGMYSFWMKDMRFPLDIVWIGQDKTIISVSSNISPAAYPESFASPSPVMYVLEVNAGAAARLGIVEGAKLAF